MLLSVPPEWSEVQNEMSEVCEMCWGREVEGREGVVPNCLLYILARTFSEGATVSHSTLSPMVVPGVLIGGFQFKICPAHRKQMWGGCGLCEEHSCY